VVALRVVINAVLEQIQRRRLDKRVEIILQEEGHLTVVDVLDQVPERLQLEVVLATVVVSHSTIHLLH
jgi:hypothetical protein